MYKGKRNNLPVTEDTSKRTRFECELHKSVLFKPNTKFICVQHMARSCDLFPRGRLNQLWEISSLLNMFKRTFFGGGVVGERAGVGGFIWVRTFSSLLLERNVFSCSGHFYLGSSLRIQPRGGCIRRLPWKLCISFSFFQCISECYEVQCKFSPQSTLNSTSSFGTHF